MKRLAAGCLIAAVCTVQAQNMKPESFKSVYAVRDVALDTGPGKRFWRGTRPVYVEVNSHGHLIPEYRTEVRSRWTSSISMFYLFAFTMNFI